ncbi:MAG TPA: heterodisulfide reductase-related iron-sulfur binding cluster [Candidatus Limnocylindrales bacterium]|nr:heterodisulfide reductase-related iron-sulfur binding cluster [Candidatus Limnocylindrales bacterium]
MPAAAALFPAFADVPGYPLVFVLFWGAVGYFVLAMARHLRVFAAARAEGPSPLDDVGARVLGVIEYAFVQTKMFKDPRAALMHWGIFWGFVLLTIGTANVVTGGLIQAVLSIPFDGLLWALVLGMQNVVAVVTILAVLWALERRLIEKPARLELNRDALTILYMIGGLVAAELLALAFEVARYGAQDGAFIADAIAVPLRSTLSTGTLEVGFAFLWWAHMVLVSAFLVYLPGSKHLHVATAFPNIYFRKLRPRGELPKMELDLEAAADPSAPAPVFGVRTLADLGWRDLLDGFTCTECGRCQQQCPAWNTGKPLNPKTFIMGLREMSVEAEHGLPLIPNSPAVRATYGLDDSLQPARLMKPIVDDAIPYDAVWDCVTCGACVEACPVLIEHVDKIVGLRRNLVLEDSRFPQELNGAFRGMESVQNPWGQPPSTRTDWTGGLPFSVPTVASLAAEGRLDEIEVLYWVGCAAAFDERNRKVARAFATCLDAAGVRFAILGQEESCTGDPARRMGNDYVFQMLAQGNVDTLNRYRMGERTIVTACPHCFNSIGNEYGQLGGHFSVMHHSAYLRGLIAAGRLRLLDDGMPARSVTLHDSCYLTRYNGIVQEPRDVLASVPGLELREMDNHGRQTFCCGAGGGRMWMEETRGTRINASRTAQALATGASTVATECPYCMTMLKDGLEASADNADGAVKAIDIAELLAESLAPDQPGARALPVIQ